MKLSLQSSKGETDLLEVIVKCKQCLIGEYLCENHAQAIKEVVLKEVKSEIEKISSRN